MPSAEGILLRAVDRLAFRILGALNRIFAVQYSKDSDFYIYEASFVTGASDAIGTNYQGAILVGQEGDFVATRVQCGTRVNADGIVIGTASVQATIQAGDLPDAPFTILITDTSSARQLMNEAVDAQLCFGTHGGLPGVWPRAKLFNRNSSIGLRLTSLKLPSSAWTHRVAFLGWRIYDARALDLTSPN